MIAFSKLFGFLTPRHRGAAAIVTMAVLMAVVGVVIAVIV